MNWTRGWPERLADYVRKGGVVVLNAAQVKGLPESLLGIRMSNATAEADNAKCAIDAQENQDLRGQMFRYERVNPQPPKSY